MAIGPGLGAHECPTSEHPNAVISAATSYDARRVPAKPNPLLQNNVTASADLHNLRKEENELLEKGGFNATIKRQTIPLSVAIDEEAAQLGQKLGSQNLPNQMSGQVRPSAQ